MTSFNFLHLFNDYSNVYVSRRKFISFKSLLPERCDEENENDDNENLKRVCEFFQKKSTVYHQHSIIYPITMLFSKNLQNASLYLSLEFPLLLKVVCYFICGYCARVFERAKFIFERLSMLPVLKDSTLQKKI